jgi:hypothetical protein
MICLTFDTDHLNEARLVEFFSTHKIVGGATFFCTQQFEHLAHSDHELAPHPYLAAGVDWTAELSSKRRMFPDALGWRSHSCVFSHLIGRWLGDNGYQYVSIEERFGQQGMSPSRFPMGSIWQVPIYYMDTFDISRRRFWPNGGFHPFDPTLINRALADDGLYVFDFHPVHIMLNTPTPEFYMEARDRYRGGAAIERLRYDGTGVGTFFTRLCERMEAAHVSSVSVADALVAYMSYGAESGRL